MYFYLKLKSCIVKIKEKSSKCVILALRVNIKAIIGTHLSLSPHNEPLISRVSPKLTTGVLLRSLNDVINPTTAENRLMT